MSENDTKLVYNLLCSADILKYLDYEDKTELYYCCKYIYEKSTKFRLGFYYFKESEFQVYMDNNHKGLNWKTDDYELNLEYFDTFVNKYKGNIRMLVYHLNDYYLIEHFSQNFTNLKTLYLAYIAIPKTTLKRIIKNLPNLKSLVFICIEAVYSKNDTQITDFKFSQYLRELRLNNCSQSELDSTYYSSIKHIYVIQSL
jgi:hypothetical protein